MLLLLPLLLVASSVLIQLSLACVSPYQPASGICIYQHPTVTSSVCDAAKICQDRSGVIISPDDLVQSGLSVPNKIWVGLSDSLLERGGNRDGWRYFNGSEYNNMAQWSGGQPDDYGGGEDFVILGEHFGKYLNDVPGNINIANVYCSYEQSLTRAATRFREDTSLTRMINTGTEEGCYEIELALPAQVERLSIILLQHGNATVRENDVLRLDPVSFVQE